MATETIGEADTILEGVNECTVGMPQLCFNTWPTQMFWTAVALFVLYKVLTSSILPKISGALEDRHNAIADDLDRAAELKKQAEDASKSYADALSEARANAQKIVAENQVTIDAELAAASHEADTEIEARTAESETRIGEVRAEAASSAKTIAADTAQAIIDKLAPGLGDSGAINAAVERALAAAGGSK